ncbi:hypothetical protein PENTCL1PPCAC_19844, partial [Pristionchus entomophagus]
LSSYLREGRMSGSPVKKSKHAYTITMAIDKELVEKDGQISPVHRFNGLAWRVHVMHTFRYDSSMVVLHCDSEESELWWAQTKIGITAKITNRNAPVNFPMPYTFASWKPDGKRCDKLQLIRGPLSEVSVEIQMENESESFTRRPILDLRSIPDVIFVLEGQKFPVNKKVFSALSSYFNSLLNGPFKESQQEEIEIKETDPEDFNELLKMMYGVSKEPITEENAMRYLMMADKFDIRIVRDRVENFLLSTIFILNDSIHGKFLIAEQYRLETLKSELLILYKKRENLQALKKSKEFVEVSDSVKNILYKYAFDLI